MDAVIFSRRMYSSGADVYALDERASRAYSLHGLALVNAHRASPLSRVEGMLGACVARPVMSGVHFDVLGMMVASELESRRVHRAIASGMQSFYVAHAADGLVVSFASWIGLDDEWATGMLRSPPWLRDSTSACTWLPGSGRLLVTPRGAFSGLGALTQPLGALGRPVAERSRRFGTRALCVIHYQAMRAIAHARGLGVVHGNVCPANVVVGTGLATQITGWDTSGGSGSSAANWAHCAPEVMLSESGPHLKCDVFSLGLVMLEGLRGAPLVEACDAGDAARVLRRLIRSFGSPPETALAEMGVSLPSCTGKVVAPLSWDKLLCGRRISADCRSVLRAMLDWNPSTRHHAAALMCAEHFYPARLRVTAALTRPETLGLIFVAFESHDSAASRGSSGSRDSELSSIDE